MRDVLYIMMQETESQRLRWYCSTGFLMFRKGRNAALVFLLLGHQVCMFARHWNSVLILAGAPLDISYLVHLVAATLIPQLVSPFGAVDEVALDELQRFCSCCPMSVIR